MYDRFGAPRVDDQVVSAAGKHGLIADRRRHQNHPDPGTSQNNSNTSEIGIELEQVYNFKVTTPAQSSSGLQAYATESYEQESTTTKQISTNIRTVAPALAVASQHQQQPTLLETLLSSSLASASSTRSATASDEATSAYQLRALTGNRIEQKRNSLNPRLSGLNSLSLNLIEETLSYFISCKQRLSQITKTFDDSDALMMLLQEKEEDLEVVGQLGQDLLRRYNELKEAYEGQRQELAKFQEELAKSREDNQQLRYDLASNRSLLDTFKEEEEQLLEQQDTSANSRVCSQCQAEDDAQTQSLRSQQDRSLTYLENELYKQMCELKDELMEVRERELSQKLLDQERGVQLELQMRDTEKRQSDLEGENESLRDQQRELQQVIETQSRRFDELLQIFSEYQRESRLHYTSNQNNLNSISFNYQTESSPSFDSQLNSLLLLDQSHHQDTHQQAHHHQTLPAQLITPTHHEQHQHHQQQQQNQQIVRPTVRKSSSGSNLVTSTSLHEELLESMHKTSGFREDDDDDDDEDGDVINLAGGRRDEEHDGADSGLHTRNISTSTTPVNSTAMSCLETDSDDSASAQPYTSSAEAAEPPVDPNNNSSSSSSSNSNLIDRLSCLGLSTFTLTTLLLLCLSATLNSNTNSNLAQKLQHINLNQ